MSLTKVTYSMIKDAAFNVQDYGAVSDGTTDNTTAIRAAAIAAAAVGGTLFFPGTGTYITDYVQIYSGTCNVYIEPGATVKLKAGATQGPIFDIGGAAQNITLYGGGILDGNSANVSAGVNPGLINISANQSQSGATRAKFVVNGLTIQNAKEDGVYIREFTANLVSNGGSYYVCIADNTASAANEPGVGVNQALYWQVYASPSAVTIINATVWASGTNYYTYRKLEQITIQNNRFSENLRNGVGVRACSDLRIIDNDFVATQTVVSGVLIEQNNGVDRTTRMTLRGNRFAACALTVSPGTSGGTQFQNPTGLIISENYITDIGVSQFAATIVGWSDVSIVNNEITQVRGGGLEFGIYSSTSENVKNIHVSGNKFNNAGNGSSTRQYALLADVSAGTSVIQTCVVEGNSFFNCAKGTYSIEAQNGVNVIVRNNAIGSVGSIAPYQGTRVYLPAGVATLPVYGQNNYRIGQTGAQSVTDITGDQFETVTILHDDANTTYVYNTSKIVTKTGANYTPAAREVVQFAKSGNVFYQIA